MNKNSTLLIGMIHLPRISNSSINDLVQYAQQEADKLVNLGFSAMLIENFNDTPFPKDTITESELVKLSIICHELSKSKKIPLGLNVLRNACRQAMVIASNTDFDFIRCNIWEGAYVTDQGIIESAAQEVIRTKRQLDSSVQVFADIFVKHAKPLVNFDPKDAAENALYRGGADRIIISGQKTGDEPSMSLLEELNKIGIKPLLGSGVNITNIQKFSSKISGAIVGTSIKENMIVTNPISLSEGEKFVANWNKYVD